MDNIYAALRLEDLVPDKKIYTSGEEVTFSYKLTNFSGERLVVPENNNYSPALYLVGIVQTWVERLGSDNNIPNFSYGDLRDGSRYGSGGEVIDIVRSLDKREIESGESIPLRRQLVTKGLPPGRYRYSIDYETFDGQIIQTLTVDIEIR